MDLNYFKDKLFDIINENNDMDISDTITDDKNNKFIVVIADKSIFEIECRQLTGIIQSDNTNHIKKGAS